MQLDARDFAALDWAAGFPGAVTVCDRHGVVLYLNPPAAESYASSGGYALLGKNLLDCHPAAARVTVEELLASGQPNVYTIEKGGQRKLVYQSPWQAGGAYAGFVELVLELPAVMPHHVRDPQ